ncbi:MAG: WD40 repeat domain-containing protein [Leptolyngbyaceae cyanobacterium SL_1_1]|nr:WD40 repeat domain-containing protein [Leptolyngbyaceae cyanobacterium RM1_1_2]NJO08757.1 WD40 repeat domain-containing protein [Leptolyngbyaceae cyanobacterium SL_1_1]
MSRQISTEVSAQVLHYEPSGPPVSFELVVYNDSPQFATFQLELSAAGADNQPQQEWYRIAPSVSSKLPSGDRARFTVEIYSIPPIPGGFTGTMNLTVRVFSMELRDEDRQVLRLVIAGSGILSPKLTMPTRQFKVYPDSQLELSLDVYNPNPQSADIAVAIDGIPASWFPDGAEKRLHLRAGETANSVFLCRIPAPVKAASQVYGFTVEAAQPSALPAQLQGGLTVLPKGFVEFHYVPLRQQMPSRPGRWRNPRDSVSSYEIACLNQSNLAQEITVDVFYQNPREERRRQLAEADHAELMTTFKAAESGAESESEAGADTVLFPPPKNALVIQPNPAQVGVGDRQKLQLEVYRRLPWLGWPRRQRLLVQAKADSELELRQHQQVLELDIFPVLPFWLQLLVSLAGLLLVGLTWWLLTHQGHSGPVNSLQLSGRADEAVSASDDQTLRLWQVRGRKLSPEAVLYKGDKAIRVVRYRPVDNNWVWAGFENGDIQGWNLLNQQQFFYSYRQDDRVFDLALSRDARSLFSGHGSGLVLQWDISPANLSATRSEPDRGFEVDFAVQSLALVGPREDHLRSPDAITSWFCLT